MCGRYFLSKDFRELVRQLFRQMGAGFDAAGLDAFGSAERDVFPSQESLILCRGDEGNGLGAYPMKWGFSSPAGSGLLINARAETVRQKRTFADSVAGRRLLVPASGFYEWDGAKTKYRFLAEDGGLILLAGIWRREADGDRYTILTTEANESMRPVHERMPVMVGAEEASAWILDDKATDGFLRRPQRQLVREADEGQISMEF